jgi:phosphopantothenoylcysteine decarboxylase/phosphopantothenate--cysteine ligase
LAPEADSSLSGLRFVVTAGGTREPIDPVRFIGNRSSGKMGNELAGAAIRHGAEVTLVTSAAPPTESPGLDVVAVETAAEKLKKGAQTMSIELVPTVDILRSLRDDEAALGIYVVGFAAETEHVIDNARAKLDAKQLDLVVVNDVSREGIGMGAEDNEVTVIGRDGTLETIARASKAVVADAIIRLIASRLS